MKEGEYGKRKKRGIKKTAKDLWILKEQMECCKMRKCPISGSKTSMELVADGLSFVIKSLKTEEETALLSSYTFPPRVKQEGKRMIHFIHGSLPDAV